MQFITTHFIKHWRPMGWLNTTTSTFKDQTWTVSVWNDDEITSSEYLYWSSIRLFLVFCQITSSLMMDSKNMKKASHHHASSWWHEKCPGVFQSLHLFHVLQILYTLTSPVLITKKRGQEPFFAISFLFSSKIHFKFTSFSNLSSQLTFSPSNSLPRYT